ncbi:hypothetical protein HF086_006489 [Spodoptera exigua]|uniref:RRM domain-containing protein n=1 Tax=Spodoptera exigua TaxID=7107 RepID=A0A922MNC2_SPOEX|nr:hypothetical protein HF086_006489 [Spodoptera exigua]
MPHVPSYRMEEATKPLQPVNGQKRKRKTKSKFTASQQKNEKFDNSTESAVTPEKKAVSPTKLAKLQGNSVGTKTKGKLENSADSEVSPEKKSVSPTKTAKIQSNPVGKKTKRKLDNTADTATTSEKTAVTPAKVAKTQNKTIGTKSKQEDGRIRQAIKASLQGTSNTIQPEIIHNKIQSILNESPNPTDSQLRRIRILYNLLKTSLEGKDKKVEFKPKVKVEKDKPEKKEKIKKETEDSPTEKEKEGKNDKGEKKEQVAKKVKGPKRYVVFLGNLPLDIDKDKFALSKHHSMLGNKRINVLYTAPKNGKQSKTSAKGKSAKLIALQKSGKLVGSIPLAKKRSQRRLKMKQAQAKLAAETA